MKNISVRTKNVLKGITVGILLTILIYMVVTLTGKISNQSVAVETASMMEENKKDVINQEDVINIEELDNFQEEQEKIVEESKEEKRTKQQDTTKNENKKSISDKTYYIKVNYGANVVTIYTKDENGEYTVPVKAMVCSTGRATPTSGTYTIKGRWRWLKMLGGVYGQYTTQIVGNILFHSVPYLKKGDSSSLEYWEYDKLGTRASAGCIRLTMQDAIWIYNNIASGTVVEFYSSSDPGPLGKPSAQKISWNEQCRGWDPTDPDPNNPWRNAQNDKQEEVDTEEIIEDSVIDSNLNDNNSSDNNMDDINKEQNNKDDNNKDGNDVDDTNKDANNVNDGNKKDDNLDGNNQDDGNKDDNNKENDDKEDNNVEDNNLNDNNV